MPQIDDLIILVFRLWAFPNKTYLSLMVVVFIEVFNPLIQLFQSSDGFLHCSSRKVLQGRSRSYWFSVVQAKGIISNWALSSSLLRLRPVVVPTEVSYHHLMTLLSSKLEPSIYCLAFLAVALSLFASSLPRCL